MQPIAAAKALALSVLVCASAQALPRNANAAALDEIHPLSAGASVVDARRTFVSPDSSSLNCGVQFKSTIPAHSSQLYFTFNWNPKHVMTWSVMDDSNPDSGPSLSLTNVGVDRNTSSTLTYWLSVSNSSDSAKAFEGRFCYQK